MSIDKNEDLTLAVMPKQGDGYVSVSKNYFSPKGQGASLSLIKKIFLWGSLLMSSALMIPQVFSESKHQEAAQEIISEQNQVGESETMSIPSIQSDDGSKNPKSRQESNDSFKQKHVDKIQSVDLRVQNAPPAGSEVTAVLISGGANGMVKARLLEDLSMNGDLYGAKNSILIGKGASSEQRLFIKFNRLISPEGKSKKISAQAYDFGDHIRGLIGKKVSDRMFKIAASSALIVLGGFADSLQTPDQGVFGGATPRRSLRDAALGGVAQSTAEQGKHYLEELDQDSRIEVKKETQLVVIFEEEDDKNE